MHIDPECLILYCEGELPSPQRESVEQHLRECDRCRREAEGLGSVRDKAVRCALPRLEEEGSAASKDLLKAMREWEAARLQATPEESVKFRAAKRVASFLGLRATHRILEPVSESGDNLLPAIEPVLATFLGRRAAADLAGHIALEAVVRL